MGRTRRKSLKPPSTLPNPIAPQDPSTADCLEGESLRNLLQRLSNEIELAGQSRGCLPEKLWLKLRFSVGVNEVTRALERMPKVGAKNLVDKPSLVHNDRHAPSILIQAVLVAADCSPRWLTKHIPSLASSRGVPVIFVRDHRGGSLRLGELVKQKTAMAIAVKARGSRLNEAISEVLRDYKPEVFLKVDDTSSKDLSCL